MSAFATFRRLFADVRAQSWSTNWIAKSYHVTPAAWEMCETGRPVTRLNASPFRAADTSPARKDSARAAVTNVWRCSRPFNSQRTV
ncbi:hypothetical protein ACFCZ2_26470 [Streptomyces sp. NPDC056202]|uniref:hypothetical protein n=1 Tax=Streptomyces sp. NPDC056202 TaxID=3345745 RepID=UPI0035DB7244